MSGDVQPEEINAKYDSGILMLTLPKKDQQTLPTQNRIAMNKFSPKCPAVYTAGAFFCSGTKLLFSVRGSGQFKPNIPAFQIC
mgnify:CR=1 FL=1